MSSAPHRVAVLGGSFDPVHLGHLSVLEQVRERIGADQGWLLPTGRQPLRSVLIASVDDRLAMATAAVLGRPGLRVVDDEARRLGTSYTIDTLERWEQENPTLEVWWILGADAARSVRSWHRADELLARARVVIVNRTGVAPVGEAEADTLGFVRDRRRLISVDSPLLSATEVRHRAAAGSPLDDLVGSAVARLIERRHLYGRCVELMP